MGRSDFEIPADELKWRFSRSSGPGGQSVNTTDSRVSLSFDLANTTALPVYLRARAVERLKGRLVDGVLTVVSEQERSQLRNREVAEERLRRLLAEATKAPPAPRRPTRPSLSAKERRIRAKKNRGKTKKLRQNRDDDDQ
ncbi:MAG: alternative ribosome rescue aminoacyl-tRNA hydrolase ArfB [Actinomycetes bacterium]